jgi:hypothetical protein
MIATIKGTIAGAIYHKQHPHSSHSQLTATSINISPPLTTDNLQHTAYDANSGSASASSIITIILATTAVVVPHQQQPQLHND